LVEQSSQEGFTPEGCHDILVAAIRWLEHRGRVRGAGSGIGIHQYFGASFR